MRFIHVAVGATLLAAGAVAACRGGLAKHAEKAEAKPLLRVAAAVCDNAGAPSKRVEDARVRAAAQRGLGFVSRDALAWQKSHECYGCHVQAVTLEALVVGKKNRYDVSRADLDAVLHGMFDIPGGAHQASGLGVGAGGGIPGTSKAFGGAAFAHYDEAVDDRARKELLQTARELLAHQTPAGQIEIGTYVNPPVALGPIQATTQALQTWRQAYERTADEQWLAPMRRAEAWIQAEAKRYTDGDVDAEHLGYAIIGLISAGSSRSEATIQSLARRLLAAQDGSGAWKYGEARSALATGLALYALRLTGMTDADPAIARGTDYLVGTQLASGGWSDLGSARAEAMWAVLGLVTVDVLSVDVAGVVDGAHLDAKTDLHATARDNAGGRVQKVDVVVDDILVKSTCGDRTDATIDASQLGDGAHTIDVLATNAAGQTARRRMQVYAGAYWLTEIGTRFEDGGTAITARDLARPDVSRDVELHVFATRVDDGAHVKADEIWRSSQKGAQGPVRFFWDGKDAKGKALPRGSYVAELRFVKGGEVVQRVETPFVHDSPEVQQQKFGEVEGQLTNDGKDAIANADVELLDKKGNVVQRVTSTAQGNYRFRNVDEGDYQVRVVRKGFAAQAAPVKAARGAAAAAPMNLHAR